MNGHKYGALRGRVVASAEERNEHVSPHYQILVMAGGDPWRIAVNVKSTDTGGSGADRSIVLYRIIDDFRHPILEGGKPLPGGPPSDRRRVKEWRARLYSGQSVQPERHAPAAARCA